MSKKNLQELENLIQATLEKDLELVDLEYVKEGLFYYLRVFIDKVGGITIDDITNATQKINEVLDREDPIEEQYFLEVSSPGLDRTLKKEKDFIREKGKSVELRLYKSKNGKKVYEGILLGLDLENKSIVIETDDEILSFQKNEVSIVRLRVDF